MNSQKFLSQRATTTAVFLAALAFAGCGDDKDDEGANDSAVDHQLDDDLLRD